MNKIWYSNFMKNSWRWCLHGINYISGKVAITDYIWRGEILNLNSDLMRRLTRPI
jgi:hypothetical protein